MQPKSRPGGLSPEGGLSTGSSKKPLWPLGAQARSAFASGTMAEEKKEEGGFFANLFNFGGGAPASAPEPESTPDVSDAPAKAESAASSAEAEKAKWLLSLEPAQIDGYEPSQVVEVLSAAVQTTPDINPSLIEACCKRLRVLCREPENCKRCDEAGTASAVVAAMGMLPTLQSVQLQALAAIVNLCSGEANEHRKNAVDSGAMTAIVAAMLALADNAEVQEMACIALQNCCYGEDDHSLTRRTTAATEGAIEAVVKAMQKHVDSPPMQEVRAHPRAHTGARMYVSVRATRALQRETPPPTHARARAHSRTPPSSPWLPPLPAFAARHGSAPLPLACSVRRHALCGWRCAPCG